MFKEYCQALYKCFFNTELYYKVVHKWRNFSGIGFLSMLVLIAVIPFSYMGVNIGYDMANIWVNHIGQTGPQVYTMKDNVLTIDKELPFEMTAAQLVPMDMFDENFELSEDDKMDMGKVLIVFKDEAKMEDLDAYPDATLIIGKKSVVHKDKQGKIEHTMYDGVPDGEIHVQEFLPFNAKEVFGIYGLWFYVIVGIVLYIAMWIGYVVKSFIVAVLSFIVTIILPEKRLIFNDRFRVAIFAMAPVFIVKEALSMAVDVELGFFTTLLAGMVYFGVIVMVAKREDAFIQSGDPLLQENLSFPNIDNDNSKDK